MDAETMRRQVLQMTYEDLVKWTPILARAGVTPLLDVALARVVNALQSADLTVEAWHDAYTFADRRLCEAQEQYWQRTLDVAGGRR